MANVLQHVQNSDFARVVGNDFSDAVVDVARSYDVVLLNVRNAQLVQNSIGQNGYPEIAGKWFFYYFRSSV